MFPKPEPRKRVQAREDRQRATQTHRVRMYVFARERGLCRVCQQPATELHELRFRSLGGKISLHNSIAVCARDHLKLQRHELIPSGDDAESPSLTFRPRTA